MATFTNLSKSTAPTFKNLVRLGSKEFVIDDLADYTFETVTFVNGKKLKDIRFDQLLKIVSTNLNKS